MDNIIDNRKLENILIRSWAEILNARKMIAFALECVRDNKSELDVVMEPDLPQKSVQVLISRFHIIPSGFEVWVDYTIPADDEIAVGTIECHLSNAGNLQATNIIGNRFVKQYPDV
tara:strand:- start:2229 stop:2576 length:348 start_codon:yes stop_codon:yes gene_type:complete